MSQGLAISVRQPFAWAIVTGHKPIENRGAALANRFRKLIGERLIICSGKNMSDTEYELAVVFMRELGAVPPHPDLMFYGCAIGSARVSAVVDHSESPWFRGPCGIVLSDARQAKEPLQIRGQLGIFSLAKQLGRAETLAFA